jgi:protein TonB
MKLLTILFFFLLVTGISKAGVIFKGDTIINNNTKPIFAALEFEPEYPGGASAFYKYISKNLRYPDVARLIGISGKVFVSFVVNRDGKIVEVTPINCLGAGCESEAVTVVSTSIPWKPGIQNGKPVRVQYTMPINFYIDIGKVSMKQLRTSNYGFVFDIKGTFYSIDKAQAILGKSFMPSQIEIAEPFYNANKDPKFEMPDKKEVYLLKIKS